MESGDKAAKPTQFNGKGLPMTLEERKRALNETLTIIRTAGYHYEMAKGGAHALPQFPPPAGSRLNCRSAAWVFLKHAHQAGVDGLQPLFFMHAKGGYLVLAVGMYQALGDPPQIQSPAFSGWEFENHYRVRDPQSAIVYDPTFCTASNTGRGNPVGVLATSEKSDPRTFSMTTVYGNRYEVKRQGVQVACRELTHRLVLPACIVDDAKFAPTALSL